MYKELWKVTDFHRTFGLPVASEPGFPDRETRDLRRLLEVEELGELILAEQKNDFPGVCDAVADLMYVLLGRCASYGIPIQQIFDEIHESNMSKLDEHGEPIMRKDGKILKGPNYFQPAISKILKDHGYLGKPKESDSGQVTGTDQSRSRAIPVILHRTEERNSVD